MVPRGQHRVDEQQGTRARAQGLDAALGDQLGHRVADRLGPLGPATDDLLARRTEQVVEPREVVGRRGERDVGLSGHRTVRHGRGAVPQDELGRGRDDAVASLGAAGLPAGDVLLGLWSHQGLPPDRLRPSVPRAAGTSGRILSTDVASPKYTIASTAVKISPIPPTHRRPHRRSTTHGRLGWPS
ncbi:hypothetical protein D3C74_370660 [compost metagenome]